MLGTRTLTDGLGERLEVRRCQVEIAELRN